MNHRQSKIIKNVEHVCKELTTGLSMETEQLQREADHSLPHMPSWCAQGQLYLLLFL